MRYSGVMSSLPARIAAALAALAAAVALGACSASSKDHADPTSTTTGPSAAPTAHNADDVTFLQNMIPHHQQALELSGMVPTHTANAQLVALAKKIADEQQPEIQGFRAQLLQWEIAPAQHEMPMEGMVDQATMDKLANLHGGQFDTLWLQSMIAHHQGAITMAHDEIAHGQSPDVKAMAHSIVTAQQAEIDQMNQMLGG